MFSFWKLFFLCRAITLDSFVKAYKASDMNEYFPYEWFDTPNKLDEEQLPSYDGFYSLSVKSLMIIKNFLKLG